MNTELNLLMLLSFLVGLLTGPLLIFVWLRQNPTWDDSTLDVPHER